MPTTEQETRSTGEIEPEVLPPESHLVRSPAIPTTIEELAALDEGPDIVEAKTLILKSFRLASIKATNPQDWLLFKAVDPSGGSERITGFLSDQGCQRIRPLWGIDITPTSEFEKITAEDGEFAYLIRGDGFCSTTNRKVTDVEGLRYSTDRFLDGLTAIMKEMRVRQAARANLDGTITRKLTGMGNIAAEELEEAWAGTWKKLDLCARGKGYGTGKERAGDADSKAPSGKGPLCEHEKCGKPMKFWAAKGDMVAAYKCPEFKWDSTTRTSNGHSRITLAEYQKQQAAAAKADGEKEAGAEG